MRSYTDEKRILEQKRMMLYQVIQTIDHQNRMQNAYDGLFQYLI